MYAATRAAGFGDEVKRRIMIGTYVLTRRVLRRLFHQGAEGPHADQAGLRQGVRAVRRDPDPDRAERRLRHRRDDRPAGDVPQRRVRRPRQPRRPARDERSRRARRARPSARPAPDRQGARRAGRAQRRPGDRGARGLHARRRSGGNGCRCSTFRIRAKPANGRSWSASRSTRRSPRRRPSCSRAPDRFGAEPNTQVSLVDAAMPGMLPVRTASASARRCAPAWRSTRRSTPGAGSTGRTTSTPTSAGLPDQPALPPAGRRGRNRGAGRREGRQQAKAIGIERIHVEQDAGKLMHDQHPTMTYVDLNRWGVALMEIVTRPDMRSPAEAGAYFRKLQRDPSLRRLLRRQHGRRLDARRRQRQRAQAGGRTSAPGRKPRTSTRCAS